MMDMRWCIAISTLAVAVSACRGEGSGPPGGAVMDGGGISDGRTADGATGADGPGAEDAGLLDAGLLDAGTSDAPTRSDAAPSDPPFHPRYSYQAIDAPSPRTRLVFDDERDAIYGVNRVDEQIERFAFAGGTWFAAAPRLVARLADVVMAHDQRSLMVVTRSELAEIPLASGDFVPEHRANNLNPFCGAAFDHAAVAANGKMFIVRELIACSGSASAYFYDVAARTLTGSVLLDFGVARSSGDGTRMYIAGGVLDALFIYNGLTGSLTTAPVAHHVSAISVSDNASRVILENARVYSRSLTFLGNLRVGGVALASHDSRRAFQYREDAPGPRIEIYDLDAELQPGNLYPVLGTVPVPDAPNATGGTHPPIVMTSTPDDTVVFVSGDRRLLVVPLDAR